MKKYIANLLTTFRIIGSVFLLFLPINSLSFSTMYLMCGFSDMIDGTVARMTHSSSAFGAKLDSIADILFAGVSFLKFLPVITLPGWMWCTLLGVLLISIGYLIWRFG